MENTSVSQCMDLVWDYCASLRMFGLGFKVLGLSCSAEVEGLGFEFCR